jgi:uncharacterized membrane protein YedE/YeeE
MSPLTLSLWAGFLIGGAFGITVQRTGFCLNSAFRGLLVTGDRRKLSGFLLAMAVAVLATQTFEALGLIDLRRTIYLSAASSWLTIPVGGAIFGYGMIMSNGCGARSIVLLGQGNLRSFVVLLCLGIAAYATLSGVIAPLRIALVGATTMTFDRPPSIPRYLEPSLGVYAARALAALLLAALLSAIAFGNAAFRNSPRDIAGGAIVGMLIAAGWLATGYLGADDFEPAPIASLTFIAPVAMLATGTRLSFGVAVVCGVFLGALVSAFMTGTVELQGFSRPTQMLRYMAGGTMMGIGGALALGCSIGQGLTGFSTLSFASFLAVAGIAAGSTLALRGPLRLPNL